MAFNVTLRQSGRQFQVEHDEPVLSAALRQGIGLPYGCKNGACGSCKGTVVSGEVEQAPHSSSALSNDEKTRGMALLVLRDRAAPISKSISAKSRVSATCRSRSCRAA